MCDSQTSCVYNVKTDFNDDAYVEKKIKVIEAYFTSRIGEIKKMLSEDKGSIFDFVDMAVMIGALANATDTESKCDTIGYKWENDKWVATDGSGTIYEYLSGDAYTYNKTNETLLSEGLIISKDGTYVLAPEHDAAQVQWGGDWRMPTYQELKDLEKNCVWTWTTTNGVYGYVISGKGDYASNSIFLPCAGIGHGTSLSNYGSRGNYWSSVPYSNYNNAYELSFNSSDPSTSYCGRNYGLSVRPVQGFTK